jgi:hypothetical protein
LYVNHGHDSKDFGLGDVKYNAAIEAALRAYSGCDYVESALMPRVTAIVRRVGADVTRSNWAASGFSVPTMLCPE